MEDEQEGETPPTSQHEKWQFICVGIAIQSSATVNSHIKTDLNAHSKNVTYGIYIEEFNEENKLKLNTSVCMKSCALSSK